MEINPSAFFDKGKEVLRNPGRNIGARLRKRRRAEGEKVRKRRRSYLSETRASASSSARRTYLGCARLAAQYGFGYVAANIPRGLDQGCYSIQIWMQEDERNI